MVERGWLKWCEFPFETFSCVSTFVCFTRTQHICLILLGLTASLAVAVGQMRASGLNTNNDCVERRLCTVQKSKSSSFWFPESCEQHRKQTHTGESEAFLCNIGVFVGSPVLQKESFLCVFVLLQVFMILNLVCHFYIHKTLRIFKPKFQPFKPRHTGLVQSRDVINIEFIKPVLSFCMSHNLCLCSSYF